MLSRPTTLDGDVSPTAPQTAIGIEVLPYDVLGNDFTKPEMERQEARSDIAPILGDFADGLGSYHIERYRAN